MLFDENLYGTLKSDTPLVQLSVELTVSYVVYILRHPLIQRGVGTGGRSDKRSLYYQFSTSSIQYDDFLKHILTILKKLNL